MSEKNEVAKPLQENKLPPARTAKELLAREDVKQKFQEIMGKRAPAFLTSVLQVVMSSSDLQIADPASVYAAAAVAATLDLPVNNNLGFAYIIPYNIRQQDGTKRVVAQFQLGYKGFIQLAQRSGQFKTISAAPIYEGQLIGENPLTGYEFDFRAKKSDVVIGYAAYFSLINGFEKTLFMRIDEVRKHGGKYSKTYGNKYGLWNTDFEAMAIKTVIKLLLSRFAPMSIEMQKAVAVDQALIHDLDGNDVTYPDNQETEPIDKEAERVIHLLNDCKSVEELDALFPSLPDSAIDAYLERKNVLSQQ